MKLWAKTKQAAISAAGAVQTSAKSAAGAVQTGAKKLAFRREISTKRNHIRKLKQEFGLQMYEPFGNKDMDTVQTMYDTLQKQIDHINDDIHLLEEKILTLDHPGGSPYNAHILEWKKITLSPDKEIHCDRCDKLVLGKAIQCGTGEYFYHPQCFSCTSCETQFSSNQCPFLDGKPYCESCAEENEKLNQENKISDSEYKELLRWCQHNTNDFRMIDIQDFNKSWHNGLAFAALVANWRPDVLDWKSIRTNDPIATLTAAFEGAEKAGVALLLDSDQVSEADNKSIMTQVIMFQREFASKKPNPDGKNQWNFHMRSGPKHV